VNAISLLLPHILQLVSFHAFYHVGSIFDDVLRKIINTL